jgi:hypothetical protein
MYIYCWGLFTWPCFRRLVRPQHPNQSPIYLFVDRLHVGTLKKLATRPGRVLFSLCLKAGENKFLAAAAALLLPLLLLLLLLISAPLETDERVVGFAKINYAESREAPCKGFVEIELSSRTLNDPAKKFRLGNGFHKTAGASHIYSPQSKIAAFLKTPASPPLLRVWCLSYCRLLPTHRNDI